MANSGTPTFNTGRMEWGRTEQSEAEWSGPELSGTDWNGAIRNVSELGRSVVLGGYTVAL